MNLAIYLITAGLVLLVGVYLLLRHRQRRENQDAPALMLVPNAPIVPPSERLLMPAAIVV